jgi:hypothetical protein
MKNVASGRSFWPKPIVHPIMNDDSTYITMKPCGFCNRSYHCYDVAMTSCKHTFHLICLGEMLKISNKCSICAQGLHLD